MQRGDKACGDMWWLSQPSRKLAELPMSEQQQDLAVQVPLSSLLEWFDHEDKQLVVPDGEAVSNKPILPDLTSLAPRNH